VGFYYGSNQPPQEDKPGSFREAIAIMWAVFTVLAKPLALLFGVLLYFVFLFWFFTVNPFLGLALLSVPVIALVWRGIWEARHPPELK
jgi:hypothetical protein